jgi:hypothetical protein
LTLIENKRLASGLRSSGSCALPKTEFDDVQEYGNMEDFDRITKCKEYLEDDVSLLEMLNCG